MLPDLDKPSLKEMGITLMGDMIAILRYAKKVVEETTCERFLVDSEDAPTSAAKAVSTKPVVKKVIKEGGNKTVVSTASKVDSTKKIVKPLSTMTKKIVTIKKPISASSATNAVNQKQMPIKRKLVSEEIYEGNVADNWNIAEKKIKVNNSEDDTVEYTVTVPKVSSVRTKVLKKPIEQKRTVFDRLGDSSVTSTTNLADTSPTFNITGISKDVLKRSISVFNRLGDIDDKKDHATTAGILKNGSSVTSSPGILKSRTPSSTRTSIVTTNRVISKTVGTMHADHEASKKTTFNSTSRILKLKKDVSNSSSRPSSERINKPSVTSGKLGM